MKSSHVTGLLLAAVLSSGGTLAVVYAQDDAPVAPGAAPQPDAVGAEEQPHDHEHTPTSVHAADGTHFDLTDPEAYPDGDGFASLEERVSYAIGRLDGEQIPSQEPDLSVEEYGEGVKSGYEIESQDYARGYDLARRIKQQGGDMDVEQFLAGLAAGMEEESDSRAIGFIIGSSYQERDVPLSPSSYINGVSDGIALSKAPAEGEAEGEGEAEKPKTKLTAEQVDETITAYGEYLNMKQEQEAIEEGQAFIDSKLEEEGWKKTESGLLYKVVEEGEGESPDSNDRVTVNYEGKLMDGTVFDSSYERGQPATFPLNRVVDGWTEGVQLMKPGATYLFVLPYDLAYGPQGSPPTIPPFAPLEFKVELISVEEVEGPAPAPAAPEEEAEEAAEAPEEAAE